MNKDKFFIGVGPGKTGGTWLYRTLQQHPDAQIPPIKELNYFSIEQNVGKTNVIDSLFSKRHLIKLKRKWSFLVLRNAIKPIFKLKRINWQNIRWVIHFFVCLLVIIGTKDYFLKTNYQEILAQLIVEFRKKL